MKHDPLHIAIAFDENYLTPVYALLASIYKNNKQDKVCVHAITTGVDSAQHDKLQRYVAGYGGDIQYYTIEGSFAKDFVLPTTAWWTPSIYYRLMFPVLLPPVIKKFLYIDTDILILGSLNLLFAIDMSEIPVAAVRDFMEPRPELGILNSGDYFNSGVLLINRSEWLRRDITNKVIEYIKKNPDKLIYPDQDALNVVLANNWLKLNSRFNMMFREIPIDQPRAYIQNFLQGVVVLHYTSQHKPWAMTGRNKLRWIYFDYLKMVPKEYRKKYLNFAWNRHRIREMIEIRLSELVIEHPKLKKIFNLKRF